MYKNGFGINDLQWLMCPKTKAIQSKPIRWEKIIIGRCSILVKINSNPNINDIRFTFEIWH